MDGVFVEWSMPADAPFIHAPDARPKISEGGD